MQTQSTEIKKWNKNGVMNFFQKNKDRKSDERKEQIELYKQGVSNQHKAFGGTIIAPNDNTPDEIQFFGYHNYNSKNSYPFFYVMLPERNKIFYGAPGTMHSNILANVRDSGENDTAFMYMKNSNGNKSISGRYFLVDFNAIPKQCVVFTFWKIQDINKIYEIVYEICKEKHFFDKEIFIANGRSPLIHYNDFTPGEYDDKIEDNSQQFVQHLLPPEQKHKMTGSFRQTRGEMLGKKLGNMTQAEWNNMKYGCIDENKLINKAGITELSMLPNNYFECVNKYYTNGELTTSDGKFIPSTCKHLNEVLKYVSITGDNISGLTMRELFLKRLLRCLEQLMTMQQP